MTRTSDITDARQRASIENAERHLDDGDYLEAVRFCAEAFLALVRARPDILRPDSPRRPSVWPQLGVKLETEGPEGPRLVWERERFTMSEAALFLEFTMDQLVRAQRTPSPA